MLPTRLADPFWQTARQYWTNPNDNRRTTDLIVVHHAAAEYPLGLAIQRIYDYHKARWPDYHAAGYHEIIQLERDGSLQAYQMNPDNIIAAGVMDRNGNTYHICAALNLSNDIPHQLWIDALALRVAAAKRRYVGAQIVGHREIALPEFPSICPGNKWFLWKPTLLAQVTSLLTQQPPVVQRYRIAKVPIYQRQDGAGPIAGYIEHTGEHVGIDKIYDNGMAHLSDGRGFVRLSLLERVA